MILLEQERQQGLCVIPVEIGISTPKRKASGSNPLRNVATDAENLGFARFYGVFFGFENRKRAGNIKTPLFQSAIMKQTVKNLILHESIRR